MTLEEIARQHGAAVGPRCTDRQRNVLSDVARCRTESLGGHVQHCEACGHDTPVYNSCRNRHCPQCQSLDQARWLEERTALILPVPYFHVVFTLPSELREIARCNAKVVYGLLARLGAATLLEVAATPRHLGAQPRSAESRPTVTGTPEPWPEMLVSLCNVDVCVCTRCGRKAVVRRPLGEPSASRLFAPDTS